MDVPTFATEVKANTSSKLAEPVTDVAIALATQNHQAIGDLASMMFPKPIQLAASFATTEVVWQIFKQVFDVAASQGAKFDGSGLVIAKIKLVKTTQYTKKII